ncbi:transcriptional regulator, TetR family [Blastococcus aggregatus]|uniref:Transcriptional regulator, TetR family n=1 Tax=Blastococcus aggregatus TaxID=38502 RepID=A0A285UXX4_9ACTN|nr:transcriptional regulator, TetR family [Blastococcus aggregatus]
MEEPRRTGPTLTTTTYRRAVDARSGTGPGTPPNLTVREELREATRQRLLSAAEEIFQRDGYSGTTVGNIAAAANVSRAAFYLHFTDKADALITLMRANLAETPEYWREVDAALVSGDRTALRASLRNTLTWYEQHAHLLRPVREALAAHPHLTQKVQGNFARFADEMSGYLDRVPARDRDRARLRLQLLIIQLDQLAYRLVVLGNTSIDRDVMLDEVTEIWRLTLPAAAQPG